MFESNLPDNVIPADFYEDDPWEGHVCKECRYFTKLDASFNTDKCACLYYAIADGGVCVDAVDRETAACECFES